MDGAVKSALNPGGTTAGVGGQNRKMIMLAFRQNILLLLCLR